MFLLLFSVSSSVSHQVFLGLLVSLSVTIYSKLAVVPVEQLSFLAATIYQSHRDLSFYSHNNNSNGVFVALSLRSLSLVL